MGFRSPIANPGGVRKRDHAHQKERLQAELRAARLRAGLSQADLARTLDRNQSFVSKYESGERRLDVLELRDICRALGVPFTTFTKKLDRALG